MLVDDPLAVDRPVLVVPVAAPVHERQRTDQRQAGAQSVGDVDLQQLVAHAGIALVVADEPAVLEVDERRSGAGAAHVAAVVHAAERHVDPEAALGADAVLALGQERAAASVAGGSRRRAGEGQRQDNGDRDGSRPKHRGFALGQRSTRGSVQAGNKTNGQTTTNGERERTETERTMAGQSGLDFRGAERPPRPRWRPLGHYLDDQALRGGVVEPGARVGAVRRDLAVGVGHVAALVDGDGRTEGRRRTRACPPQRSTR